VNTDSDVDGQRKILVRPMLIHIEDRRFAVAPMLDYTDRHARYLYRLLSTRALLYTEMISTGTLLHGLAKTTLALHAEASPVAAQLGGSEPEALALCAKLVENAGFDEVNLNLGCPSERVQRGQFGASLMKQPSKVADCILAMQDAVSIPVTVKCRTGVDEQDSYPQFAEFIGLLQEAGCSVFVVHARKAWLRGVSPKNNRKIPSLHYEYVHQLKRDFPQLTVVLNGGLKALIEVHTHLTAVDGVMLGRAVYNNPWMLSTVDQEVYRQQLLPVDRFEIASSYYLYCRQQSALGVPLWVLIRPLFGLFYGQPGARLWRQQLSESLQEPSATVAVINDALQHIQLSEQCSGNNSM